MVVTKAKVRKVGNSHGIIFPSHILDLLKLAAGQELELSIDGDALIITKSVPSLKELVDSVPKSMRLKEVATGAAVGKEIIK